MDIEEFITKSPHNLSYIDGFKQKPERKRHAGEDHQAAAGSARAHGGGPSVTARAYPEEDSQAESGSNLNIFYNKISTQIYKELHVQGNFSHVLCLQGFLFAACHQL